MIRLLNNLPLLIFILALIFFGFYAFSNKEKISIKFGEVISAIFGSLLVYSSFIYMYNKITSTSEGFNFDIISIFLIAVGLFGVWLIIRNFFNKIPENKNFVDQRDMTELKTPSQVRNDGNLEKGRLWLITILSIILPPIVAITLSYMIFSGEEWGKPLQMLPWLILYAIIAGSFFGKMIKPKSLISFVLFYILLVYLAYIIVGWFYHFIN